jgi:hypothetical protein
MLMPLVLDSQFEQPVFGGCITPGELVNGDSLVADTRNGSLPFQRIQERHWPIILLQNHSFGFKGLFLIKTSTRPRELAHTDIPSYLEGEHRRIMVQGLPGQSYWKNKAKRTEDVSQVAEHLPSKLKALGSNLNNAKTNNKNKQIKQAVECWVSWLVLVHESYESVPVFRNFVS